jgi:branched-chain amino acid aminotransferase
LPELHLVTTFVNYNGTLIDQETPVITAGNRGLRYGDGLFETMKMLEGKIRFFDLHMERLFQGLDLLKFEIPAHFSKESLKEEIIKLCRRNGVEKAARIRLNVFRGNGGLFDPENLKPNYLVEATPLPDNYQRLNENGLVLDVYPDACKSCDILANSKTNNYLPYVMAALFAKQNRLNDCFILNQHRRICDTTIANVFWIREGEVYTPPLSEGCVAGIMRRYLVEKLENAGYVLKEKILTINGLENASEVFLTNAAYGIRWVKQFRNTSYSHVLTQKIYKEFIQTKG